MIAKRVLIGIGLLFIVNGLIIAGLRLAQVIPRSYGWLVPLFLALGTVGTLTASFGLRDDRRWPLVVLGLVYVPWTIVGLIGDTRQGYLASGCGRDPRIGAGRLGDHHPHAAGRLTRHPAVALNEPGLFHGEVFGIRDFIFGSPNAPQAPSACILGGQEGRQEPQSMGRRQATLIDRDLPSHGPQARGQDMPLPPFLEVIFTSQVRRLITDA